MSENNNLKTIVKEKTVTMHTVFIVIVCVLFSIINFLDGVTLNAVLIFFGGVAAAVVSFASRGRIKLESRGFILSIMQLLIIIFMSVAKHEMQDMFALMLASMSIAAVYYNKQCVYTHWIIMDVAAIVGLIFNDMFYGGAEISSLVRGVAGINIGAALICYLISCSINYINEARIAQEKSDKLVKEVQDHVEEVNKMSEKQAQVVSSVATISGNLARTSSQMQSVSNRLSDNADRQQTNIEGIVNDIARIDEGADESLKKAKMAFDSAESSARLMMQSNDGMQNMVVAMEEIENTSKKINNIVKNIEDIAFQTNILALNASIEAARAGSAGKGFAVVASEVRNLAAKSQDAVDNTSELIDATIAAIERGKSVADEVAILMDSVIGTASESSKYASSIASLTEKQVLSISEIRKSIEDISSVISETVKTSEESADLASTVANETMNIDRIVSRFR